jgi:hypothetical protein
MLQYADFASLFSLTSLKDVGGSDSLAGRWGEHVPVPSQLQPGTLLLLASRLSGDLGNTRWSPVNALASCWWVDLQLQHGAGSRSTSRCCYSYGNAVNQTCEGEIVSQCLLIPTRAARRRPNYTVRWIRKLSPCSSNVQFLPSCLGHKPSGPSILC